MFDWLLPALDIGPVMETPPGVEVKERSGPAGRVLLLLNHSDEPVTISIGDGLVDAVTAKKVGEQLFIGVRGVRILHRP